MMEANSYLRDWSYDGSFMSYSLDDDEIETRHEKLKERVRSLWNRHFGSNLKTVASLKTIGNGIFIMTVVVVCAQQCFSQISEYLKYNTRLQVVHSFPTSTLWLMPGITICNNNRVRMARLTEQSEELKDNLRKATNHTKVVDLVFLPEAKKIELMKKVKELVDEFVNITYIVNDLPVSKLLELSSSASMIKDINCNALWGKSFNCENFRIFESFQAGPCYTIFYSGALLEALASGRAYDFNSSLLAGGVQRKLDSFNDHEIAEILVDFEPFQHTDFQRDIGGKLSVHSTGHIGSVRDMAHSIQPGYHYNIIIRRLMTKRLPPPYKSMCHDYKYQNSYKFTTEEGSLPSVELDKTTCVRNCIIRRTTKACNCWPVEVPFYSGDTIVEGSDSLQMCRWGFEDAQRNYSVPLYLECYKRFQAECQDQCRPACRTEEFRVRVTSTPWPSKGMFLVAKSKVERMELHRMKVCYAKISIKYSEYMENRHIMYPSLTLAQLISNIGGIVSALVGVSAVTIYRYVSWKMFRCKIVNDHEMPTTTAKTRADKLAPGGLKTLSSGAKLCKYGARVAPCSSVSQPR